MNTRYTRHLASAALLCLLAACASQQAPSVAPSAQAQSGSSTANTSSAGTNLPGGSAQSLSSGKSAPHDSVYFGYDEYSLDTGDQALVERYAGYLRDNKAQRLLIQGNADERGSSEYNLALGQKRANVVKQGLEALGVDASRLEAVSFGKEKPVCTTSDEACYGKNRRADMVYPAK